MVHLNRIVRYGSIVSAFFHLTYCEVRPCYSMYQCIVSFDCWVVFHFVDVGTTFENRCSGSAVCVPPSGPRQGLSPAQLFVLPLVWVVPHPHSYPAFSWNKSEHVTCLATCSSRRTLGNHCPVRWSCHFPPWQALLLSPLSSFSSLPGALCLGSTELSVNPLQPQTSHCFSPPRALGASSPLGLECSFASSLPLLHYPLVVGDSPRKLPSPEVLPQIPGWSESPYASWNLPNYFTTTMY